MRTVNRKKPKPGGRRKRPSKRTRRPGALARLWQKVALASVPAWPGNVLAISVITAAGIYGLVSADYIKIPEPELTYIGERASSFAGLTIKRISVRGHKMARPKEVMRALGAKRGSPILSFDTARARARLERLGWVASADVARMLPDEIRVTVTERIPYALWQLRSRVRVIDKEGVVLPRLEIRNHLDLPLVVGEGAAREAAKIFRLLEAHETLRERVSAVVRVAARRWNLRLDNGIDVKLPEGPLKPVLARLVEYDRTHQLLSRDLVALDLRLPDRVTVRLANGRSAAGAVKVTDNRSVRPRE